MRLAPGRRLARAARGPSAFTRRSAMPQAQRSEPSVQVVAPASRELPGKPVFKNTDGMRVDDGRYTRFKQDMRAILGEDRVVDDPVRTFAFGTDASFYRLNPQVVVRVKNEAEVVDTLAVARTHQTPVTFRAAGTSLSGQAITDSVLMKISHNGQAWRKHKVADGGRKITLEPALIGGEVNRILAAYAKKTKAKTQYKIGPDPASIDSCMIGGARRSAATASAAGTRGC